MRKNSLLAQKCNEMEYVQLIEISKPYFLHILKLRKFDIIHAHETRAAQLALIVNLLFKTKYVVTRRVITKIKNNAFNKLLYSKAAAVVSLSTAVQKTVEEICETAHHVIIPDCSTIETSHVTTKKRVDGEPFIIGHIGELHESDKGQMNILRIANRIYDYSSSIIFKFYGRGADKEKFESYIQENSIKNVQIMGFVNNLQQEIANFDIFVFPSHREGFGSILIDVMKLSKPVIATNVGGIPEIVTDNYNGFLIEKGDSTELLAKIKKLFENPNMIENFSLNAIKTAEKFTPDIISKKYSEIYLGL